MDMKDVTRIIVGGVLRQWWDDATPRTYREYGETGVETLARPYTPEENAGADQRALDATAATNADAITDLATLQGRLTRLAAYKTDADIVAALARANTVAATTQERNRLDKVILRRQARQDAAITLLVRLIDPALLLSITDTVD